MTSTSTKPIFNSKGQQVRTGERIASGGEGVVLATLSHPQSVAKIYKTAPGATQSSKIKYMVANQSSSLLQLAAWPTETLHSSPSGPVIGILMPRIKDAQSIHLLYNPGSRKKQFPEASWAFLVHAATNTARAFAVVHQHNHVIGDVNHSNLLIHTDGTVKLIDCDSFEIITLSGQRFRCGVGVPDYTPPELSGVSFQSINRTQNHDLFGLAVLIFQLLMLGRHPYTGVYRGGMDAMPLPQAIKEHRFAYGQEAADLMMEPPQQAPRLDILPSSIGRLFEQAFARSADGPTGRPPAERWIESLTQLSRSLRTCSVVNHHRYSAHYSSCPWCRLERSSGTIAFPIPVTRPAPTGGITQPIADRDLDAMWVAITAIATPSAPPNLSVAPTGLKPAPPEYATLRRAKRNRTLQLMLVLTVAEFFIIPVTGFGAVAWVALIVGFIVISYARKPAAYKKVRSDVANELELANTDWIRARETWNSRTSTNDFNSKLQHYRTLVDKHKEITEREKTLIAQANAGEESRQREAFMRAMLISNASIPHIGPQRAAKLAQYGVRCANDITYTKVIAIPGFGESMASSLMGWKSSVQSRFSFQHSSSELTSRIRDIRVNTDIQRRMIETELKAGPTTLTSIKAKLEQHQSTLFTPTIAAMTRYEQAKANRKALG